MGKPLAWSLLGRCRLLRRAKDFEAGRLPTGGPFKKNQVNAVLLGFGSLRFRNTGPAPPARPTSDPLAVLSSAVATS